MDTILFFYGKKEIDEPVVEPVGLKSYMLIRVGLNVKEEEWFGLRLGMREASEKDHGLPVGRGTLPEENNVAAENGEKLLTEETGESWLFHPLRRLRRFHMRRQAERNEEKRKHAAEQEQMLAARACEERICRAEEAVKKLAGEIAELAGETDSCRCVYEGNIRRAVVNKSAEEENAEVIVQGNDGNRKRVLPGIWKKYFETEEFEGYGQRFWMEQLLPHAVLNHYVILGKGAEIFGLLEKYAGRMKSLRWLLPETECDEEFMDFIEDFYIEYGLAVELQTFESAAAFRRMRLAGSQPMNIIDFTGALCVNTLEVAEGSIWLDMLSSDEKKYRIKGRQKSILYFSLKEEWKQIQRRCMAPET